MGSYTVVIVPDSAGDSSDSSDAPRITIRIDTTPTNARITGIAIRTTAPTGLTARNVPDVDISAIVTALAARFPPPGLRARSAEPSPAAPAQWPEQAVLGEVWTATGPRTAPPLRIAHDEAGRAYRRMPEISELRANYQTLGTVTAVAKHYGVPRHTAQGWIGRLRKLDQSSQANSSNDN